MINLPFACTNCLDLRLNFSTQARTMMYSSTSMFPVLLMILLLALYHTSEGIEYHVKPTDPEVAQCPGQPCQTLVEYLENSTWDDTSHSKVTLPMLELQSCPDITEYLDLFLSGLHSTLLCLVVQESTPLSKSLLRARRYFKVYRSRRVSGTPGVAAQCPASSCRTWSCCLCVCMVHKWQYTDN